MSVGRDFTVADSEAKVAKVSRKVALLTGATGQDGVCLTEFLLEKGPSSTASSDARRHLIPSVRIIFMSTRVNMTRGSSSTTAI